MKRYIKSLALLLFTLILTACQSEPEIETTHYELNAEGITIDISITHLGEVLHNYTAHTTLPFTEETRNDLETIVKQSKTRYSNYEGVSFTSDFFDDYVVTTQSLNFAEMNIEELGNDPTFADFASGTITFSELEKAFKTQGFQEVESE